MQLFLDRLPVLLQLRGSLISPSEPHFLLCSKHLAQPSSHPNTPPPRRCDQQQRFPCSFEPGSCILLHASPCCTVPPLLVAHHHPQSINRGGHWLGNHHCKKISNSSLSQSLTLLVLRFQGKKEGSYLYVEKKQLTFTGFQFSTTHISGQSKRIKCHIPGSLREEFSIHVC